MEEADTLVTQLRAEGIEAFLPDEALMSVVVWNVNTYGYVRVKVPTGQYESATEFLIERNAQPVSPNDADYVAKMSKALAPLPLWMQWVMFFLPAGFCPALIATAFICEHYRNRGFERRADDASAIFLVGLIFWLLFWFVVVYWRPA